MELNVAVTVRIMPEGVDTDMDKIRKGVEKIVKGFGRVNSSEIKPIAFGLNSLEVVFLLDDKKGGMDKIDEMVRKIPGVSETDVLGITRI
ncbi:MAG: hypothetical protein MSIBF_03600 [Candidatus Altiarchaeales archaeon IMC4]|nr:MAG: hypothetical protein MSIBF_03600 [Candidatus Altiarchaeales archaeon IMC4]